MITKEGGGMAVDWLRIKTEYINGGISYRKIAEKYGVSFAVLKDKAVKERWAEAREQHANNIRTATEQKTVDKISDALSEEAAARATMRAGLFRLAADWVNNQKKVTNTNDFRRMVQSCCDLMSLEEAGNKEIADDGLLEALGKNASSLFDDGDDSGMLPDEEDEAQ